MTADISAESPLYSPPQIIPEAQALLSQGIDDARSHNFERAIARFTQVIEFRLFHSTTAAKSDVAKSYYHRGCALCSMERYEQAIADFDQVIEHNHTAYHQTLILENSLSAEPVKSEPVKSEPVKSEPVKSEPVKSIETYIHRGNAHRHVGNHPLALADLTQGVKRSGGSAQSYGARGLLRLDMGNFADAIADFDRAITVHPTFAQGYLWRGFARLRSHEPARALADLSRAIESIPTCAEAYNHRGVAYFYLNAFEAARADFDQAIRLDSQFVAAYNNRGNLLQLMGDRAAAAIDCDKAIALDSSPAKLYFNRAATLCPHTPADLSDIAADYDYAAGLSVHNAAFYRHRAQARIAQGRLPAAIADYTAALAIAPSAYAHYHRGQAYVSSGQCDEALKDFEGALALSPDYGEPYEARAKLRLKLSDFEGAVADANQAIALEAPHRKETYATRCLAYFGLSQPQQAMADFDRMIDLATQH